MIARLTGTAEQRINRALFTAMLIMTALSTFVLFS